MNITRSPGMIALSIYLLLVGLIGLSGFTLGTLSILLPILALVAGILLLIGR